MWNHEQGFEKHGWSVGQRIRVHKPGSFEHGVIGSIASIEDTSGAYIDTTDSYVVCVVVCPDSHVRQSLWWNNSRDEHGYGKAPRLLHHYIYGNEMRRIAIDVDDDGNLI